MNGDETEKGSGNFAFFLMFAGVKVRFAVRLIVDLSKKHS